MAVTFYGPWSLLVMSKDAQLEGRVTISGSANSDGSFPGTPGLTIARIDGEEWTVNLEWSAEGGATWTSSAIRQTMGVTQTDGLAARGAIPIFDLA
jgi:hypothetical protein